MAAVTGGFCKQKAESERFRRTGVGAERQTLQSWALRQEGMDA